MEVLKIEPYKVALASEPDLFEKVETGCTSQNLYKSGPRRSRRDAMPCLASCRMTRVVQGFARWC